MYDEDGDPIIKKNERLNILVNTEGSIYTEDGDKISLYKNSNGYLIFDINNKQHFVHRIVMETFDPIKNFKDYEVRHKDRNKINNTVNNLFYQVKRERDSVCVKINEELINKAEDFNRTFSLLLKEKEDELKQEQNKKQTNNIENLGFIKIDQEQEKQIKNLKELFKERPIIININNIKN